MQLDAERHVRLFYDASCGPCRFFAQTVEGVGRGRVVTVPLGDRAADSALAGLAPEERFGAAHLVDDAGRHSGPGIVGPLLGLTLGPTAGTLAARFPGIERPLRWLYRRFWEYRRRHGCAAGAPA